MNYRHLLTIPYILMVFLLISCSEQGNIKVVSLKPAQNSIEYKSKRQPSPQIYYFGFDLRLSAKDDVKIYLPFLKYLTDNTNIPFSLKLSERYESNLENLGRGDIHFAALGPVSAVIAMDKYNARCLVMGLNHESRPEYRAVIFTTPESIINRVSDLRGKTFAFGDRFSTQGHLIPRKMLEDEGITLKDFKRHTYTGSQANTAKAVLNGNFDAGALQDNMAYRLQREGRIKIIAVSKPYPSSLICSHVAIPEDKINKVLKALLSFDPSNRHKDILFDWHKTEMPMGFVEFTDSYLNEVRRLLKRYKIGY